MIEPARTAPWKGGVGVASRRSTLKRFESVAVEPERVVALSPDHPALAEARTIFPSTVATTFESKRFLVSGHNSRKLGAEVEKGPWKGRPIFHVTLEERATCPRSCAMWAGCYGNSMHLARRHDHLDPDFLPALKAEVVTVARAHPQGFVVRLHTLGDFFSVEYVQVWADLLDALPNLYVFGYTARREDADEPASREIARAIRWLTDQAWDVFAIRFSGLAGPQGTIVLDRPTAHRHVVMCPAQTHQTEACATCGVCWSRAAQHKTIGFLRHGMKAPGPRKQGSPPRALRPRKLNARHREWMRRLDGGDHPRKVAEAYGVTPSAVINAVNRARAILSRGADLVLTAPDTDETAGEPPMQRDDLDSVPTGAREEPTGDAHAAAAPGEGSEATQPTVPPVLTEREMVEKFMREKGVTKLADGHAWGVDALSRSARGTGVT